MKKVFLFALWVGLVFSSLSKMLSALKPGAEDMQLGIIS